MEQLDYKELLPPDWLSPFLEPFWIRRVSGSASFFPQGVFELLFHSMPLTYSSVIHEPKAVPAGVSLVGQQLSAYRISSAQPQWVVGVRLKPFAYFQPQQLAASEVKNTIESMQHVFGISRELETLLGWLKACPEQLLEVQFQRVMAKLMPWLKRLFYSSEFAFPELLRAKTNTILDARGNILIADICQQFATSKVTLRNHFVSKIGLSPKELCKVWRMNSFLLNASHYPGDLTGAALASGYFDQAHLNREFKTVIGLTPKAYLAAQNGYDKHQSSQVIYSRFIGHYDPF
ncbi:helix-turn-helix domain-containing protein [Pseudoalteromonas sp. OOF1S-7]|uniref:AraC family transcriptional regulator n=1 Tax=Pseudoalteromonas sp. OOF1S-7 TaxID=2917757 RepID=UPI001EF414EB|nr:helix-turn-helix domain-containing protein [Pseudoalteromonas sp. OOF1S-7]MCG7537356.1 helix-turn-helix domain-containing protein [Pseudoalteromonas sp. OOF1S-7]